MNTILLIILILILILLIYLIIKFRKIEENISKIDECCCNNEITDTGLFQELIIQFPNNEEGPFDSADFITRAQELEPQLNSYDNNEFKVQICDCNDRVALLSLTNGFILGALQNSPLQGSGVKQGDGNYYVDITRETIVACGVVYVEERGKMVEFGKVNDKWIDVLILDSSVDSFDLDVLINQSSLDPSVRSRFSITHEDCAGNADKSTGHGTSVVFSFLERYFSKDRSVGVNIFVFDITRLIENNTRVVIPQFKVICALLKINNNKRYKKAKYMNMSFGFSQDIPLVSSLLETYLDSDNLVTCSAGNNGLNISNNTSNVNYPSGYSRSVMTGKICEVFGLMLDMGSLKDWNDGHGNSTNYTNPRSHAKSIHDIAVWNSTVDNSGGTSFAAPRALAKLIPN